MAKAKQPVSINDIEFDALLSEERILEAESPDYPVEDGFTVNDAIILKPQTLSMTLFVTDTPVTWLKRGHGGKGWTENVIQRLESLYFSKQTVTIVTSPKIYHNMVIQSISFTKSTEGGYARQITISFKEIRVTSSRKTTIPDSYGKSGNSGVNAGTASTNVSNTPSPSKSVSSGSSSNNNSSSGEAASAIYNTGKAIGFFN